MPPAPWIFNHSAPGTSTPCGAAVQLQLIPVLRVAEATLGPPQAANPNDRPSKRPIQRRVYGSFAMPVLIRDSAPALCHSVACWQACPTPNIVATSKGFPMICVPIGRPSVEKLLVASPRFMQRERPATPPGLPPCDQSCFPPLNYVSAVVDHASSVWDLGAECPLSAPLPASSPDSRPHKTPRGIDQRRSIVASQAWAPLSPSVASNIAGAVDLIDPPSPQAARRAA